MTTDSKKQLQTRDRSIKTMLDVKKPEISDMLPTHVNVERFIKSALLVIAGNEKLEQCSVESIVKSVIGAAELGLDFTPAKGLAYLVPFYSSKKKTMEAVFMPGYRGLIHLARNTGNVNYVEAKIVYSNEVLEIEYGSAPFIRHIPIVSGDKGNRIGAYAYAHFNDGGGQFDFMTEEEIMKIKARTKSQKNGTIFGPWADDENEMYKKTPIRRLSKMLPCSADDAYSRAVEHDNNAAGIVGITEDGSIPPSDSQTKNLLNTIKGPGNTKKPTTPEDAEYEDIDKKEKPADKKAKTSKKAEKPPEPGKETTPAEPEKETTPDREEKPKESQGSGEQKNFMDDNWKPE